MAHQRLIIINHLLYLLVHIKLIFAFSQYGNSELLSYLNFTVQKVKIQNNMYRLIQGDDAPTMKKNSQNPQGF